MLIIGCDYHPSGQQKKRQLWSKAGRDLLGNLQLDSWAARRRDDLLDSNCANSGAGVERAPEASSEARLLMTHPGIRTTDQFWRL